MLTKMYGNARRVHKKAHENKKKTKNKKKKQTQKQNDNNVRSDVRNTHGGIIYLT